MDFVRALHVGKDAVAGYWYPGTIFIPLGENYNLLSCEHKPGFFDDPDQHIQVGRKVIVFTKRGVRQIQEGFGDEDHFVNSVQDYMAGVLPRIIREANPLNSG